MRADQGISRELLPPELATQLERLTLVTRRRLVSAGQGERRSRRRGSSLEFADHRPYSPGDDPARVDWNVYGRSGQLQVKVFEAEELLSATILLDGSASMGWGEPNKFERGAQIAAALGYLGLTGGSRVRVTVLHASGAQRSRPFWGRRQAPELLRFIAAQQPDAAARGLDPTPSDDAAGGGSSLERLVRASQRGASSTRGQWSAQLVVLISDLLSANWKAALRALDHQGAELVVLHVLDSAEINPPLGGDLSLIDQETGGRLPVTLNAEVVGWYQARVQAWLAEVAEFCAQRDARYVRHVTASPLAHWLSRDLRARGILR